MSSNSRNRQNCTNILYVLITTFSSNVSCNVDDNVTELEQGNPVAERNKAKRRNNELENKKIFICEYKTMLI